MKKFMYFNTAAIPTATKRIAAYEAGTLRGVAPLAAGTTAIYFERNLGEWDNRSGRDRLTLAHDDKTATTGHRCKEIAKAVAIAANSGPHVDGMTDVVDLDNSIYLNNLSFITGVAVTLDVSGNVL